MKIFNYLFYALTPMIIGFTVYLFFMDNSYYESLNLPFKIDSKVFIIAWSLIYFLIGTAAFIIDNKKSGLGIFYLNLFLNYLWVPLFFKLQLRGFIIFYTFLLLIVVFVNMISFYKKSKVAGLLILPYFLWNLFALYLVVAIYQLN